MNAVDQSRIFEKNALNAVIKIAIVGTLVYWSYLIVQPFMVPVIWGVIIAVTTEPLIGRVAAFLGGRRKLAAGLFGLLALIAIVVPLVMLTSSSYNVVQLLVKTLDRGLTIPPPPAGVEDWPVVGPYLSKSWSLASTNLSALAKQYAPQLKTAARYLLGSAAGGLKAIFVFVFATVIATVLLATAEQGAAKWRQLVRRLAGDREPEITSLATATIRGVMLGVVGVAVIQSVLAALGLLVAGIPAIPLWSLLVLVCVVIQLPAILVLGPVAAWYFTVAGTTPAVVFLVWCLLVSSSDSLLKPILMGRGVNIPMVVILIGALGGMMLAGVVGLFIGAVV
ncbi:MAG: AI-2E family transporter, partial [Deltaproteobacteria bacterium]|nr:AI-2E family transporter [Deltaproteobacteria bacterium]